MLLDPHVRAGRLALTAIALMVLGIAACTVPTEYEAEVGKTIELGIPVGAGEVPSLSELRAFLEDSQAADEISVSLSESVDGEKEIYLVLWGQNVATGQLLEGLKERYPALTNAHLDVRDLTGTARGSFAEKIGHDLFKIEVSGDTEEEIRRQFLEQMAAHGISGDAHIEVHDDGEERTIDITIEEDQ